MIHCENLVKIYKTLDTEVLALQGLDLDVPDAELMAIIGNSGSGKSTLLNILGGLDTPNAGTVTVNGTDILRLDDKGLVNYRRNTIGFVWQNSARNLIPYLTALENVELPMQIAGKRKRSWARELLELVGLSHRERSRLNQLSGGEQQRVAIAIGLANSPPLLLADEPTGAVDTETTDAIMGVFRRFSQDLGVTVVIVTHDRQLSQAVDRVVAIRDGKTSSEFLRRQAYREVFEHDADAQADSLFPDAEDTHEEFVLVDKVGRLQIPHHEMDRLGIKPNSRLRVTAESDRLIVAPVSAVDQQQEHADVEPGSTEPAETTTDAEPGPQTEPGVQTDSKGDPRATTDSTGDQQATTDSKGDPRATTDSTGDQQATTDPE